MSVHRLRRRGKMLYLACGRCKPSEARAAGDTLAGRGEVTCPECLEVIARESRAAFQAMLDDAEWNDRAFSDTGW